MNEEPRFAISRRWIECINLLITAGYTPNYKVFCESIGIKPQSLNDIKSERRAVTLDMLYDTCNTYQVGLNYLLMGTGAKLTTAEVVTAGVYKLKTDTSNAQEQPSPSLRPPVAVEASAASHVTKGNAAFPLIDYVAAASYPTDYQRPDYYQNLPVVTLPPLLVGNSSQGILLQIQGDSMGPTFQHGDWVAGTLLDQQEWTQIRDFECFIVVSKPLGIQFKRVKNRLATLGVLRCKSENRHHPTYSLATDELLQLFRFVLHLSPNTGKMENALYQKVTQLEESTNALRASVQQLQARLDVRDGPLNA
jgi:hypothetical protein